MDRERGTGLTPGIAASAVISTPDCRKRDVNPGQSPEVIFDPQVELNSSTREPAAATLGEFRRLRNLNHAQDVPVEGPGSFFFARSMAS